MPGAPRVLFVCTGNSCRSQMAEGWTRALHPGRFDVRSAGTHPGRLDPRAVRVMAEAGVDISPQRPKHLRAPGGDAWDLVVTVCDSAREACPVVPGAARQMHAGFDDPPRLAADVATEDEVLAVYRRVRDQIRDFVAGLPNVLGGGPST